MKKFLYFVAMCFAVGISAASAHDQVFENPMSHGFRLDYCLNFARDCGRPAADRYCQRQGFDRARTWQTAPNVSDRTHCIGDHAICSREAHGQCDSFSEITCQNSHFDHPTLPSGERLDFCWDFARYCGGDAAYAFCRSRGYNEALDWRIESHVRTTRTIGTNAICDDSVHPCDSFTYITCQ